VSPRGIETAAYCNMSCSRIVEGWASATSCPLARICLPEGKASGAGLLGQMPFAGDQLPVRPRAA